MKYFFCNVTGCVEERQHGPMVKNRDAGRRLLGGEFATPQVPRYRQVSFGFSEAQWGF